MAVQRLETQTDLEIAFIQYNRLVYKYVYVFFNSKEIAEDLTQDTFIRAWKYKHTFNPQKASLKTWLVSIARSLCFDYSKKRSISTPLTQDFDNLINNDENVEKSVTNQVLIEYIYSRLSLLSENDRDLIILRFYNELTIEEVSQLINKSYDATKVAINRAFTKLKEIINNENK